MDDDSVVLEPKDGHLDNCGRGNNSSLGLNKITLVMYKSLKEKC